MAFTFRMSFTGLCAFVPRNPEGAGTVLLVNSQAPADDLNFHCNLHPHVPRMRLRSEAINLTGKVVSYSVTSPATIEPKTLQVIDPSFPLPLPTKPSPQTDQERGVFWVANMAELDGGDVDDSCFAALPNSRVAARVRLTSGYLSTSRMIEIPAGADIEWNFKKSSTGQPKFVRAMAAEFSLTALVSNGSEIHVDINDNSTGVTVRETLRPIGGEVVIPIENSCFCIDKGGPLEDFALFYRLAKSHGGIHLPYRTEGGDLSDTLCPPARFSPHTSA